MKVAQFCFYNIGQIVENTEKKERFGKGKPQKTARKREKKPFIHFIKAWTFIIKGYIIIKINDTDRRL
jgi:hypothetical protein